MRLGEPPRCQLHSRLAVPTIWQRLRIAFNALRSRVRLRTRLRQWRAGSPAATARLGATSRFATGTWVRIADAQRVFASLNTNRQLRGLLWVWQQWPYCGTVHQVLKPVRRMMDDAHRMRAVSGTVLLATAPCSGPLGQHGCGRECPLMFRDEWLEEVAPPPPSPEPDRGGRYATVRDAAEIERTLDADKQRHGLMFMPEMYAYAGRRFRILSRVERVLEGNRQVPPAHPLYLLDGMHCTGAVLGDDGPCDRGCRLIWHADWLRLE